MVSLSVFYRYVLAAPIEWADDVARGLMVAMSLLWRGGRACAQRERQRRLLRGEARFTSPQAGRRHCGAGCPGDRRVGGVVRNCAGTIHNRANDRVRPAAGIDLLSDGRRRALHDDIRARPVLSPKTVRHRRSPSSLLWRWLAQRTAGVSSERARRVQACLCSWASSGVSRAECQSGSRWRSPRSFTSGSKALCPASFSLNKWRAASTISCCSRSRSSSWSATSWRRTACPSV